MKLRVACEGRIRAVNNQMAALSELNRKLDAILEQSRRLLELTGRMEKNLEKLQAQLSKN